MTLSVSHLTVTRHRHICHRNLCNGDLCPGVAVVVARQQDHRHKAVAWWLVVWVDLGVVRVPQYAVDHVVIAVDISITIAACQRPHCCLHVPLVGWPVGAWPGGCAALEGALTHCVWEGA